MQLPLQITFRDIPPSDAVEARVRQMAEKLDRMHERIMGCRVIIEAPHQHHHKGKHYHVRVEVTVPDGEVVASREAHDRRSHEDAYVAIRDAFNAAQRQLQDYARRRRGAVKYHETPPHGRVLELYPEMDYGKIRTPDGRDVYFHRNSVLDGDFGALEVGVAVRFSEEMGDQGPQASTVRPVGKHRPAP
ncbi:MAG: HPF/RaiA family ribosome-associated protein [Gammaproteobacteria bacterium]|nr:HPF/RaiA family ribosome-associated protein [Gammaproteobacteria bacterium]